MSLRKLTVLVVDDETLLRTMLTQFLAKQGADTCEAVDGINCLEEVAQKHFEAIFLDVRMPNKDGLETLKELRQKGSHAVIIMMSGFGAISSEEDAIKHGADGFLSKPFKLKTALELLSSIQKTKGTQADYAQ